MAGASATRQFGKFATTFAVQRTDYIYPSISTQNETDYQFSFTPSFMLAQGYSVFLRSSYGLTYVDLADPILQDSSGYSIDAGVNGQITPSLNGTISLGFTHEQLAASGTNTLHNIDGVDSNVTLSYTHPLRPNTTHSISFYRDPGVALLLKSSSIVQATGVSYTLSHRLNRFLTLSPQVGWTHLVSLYSTGEIADLVQVGFSLQRTFTKNLTGTFSYRYQSRTSNLPANSYDVNDVIDRRELHVLVRRLVHLRCIRTLSLQLFCCCPVTALSANGLAWLDGFSSFSDPKPCDSLRHGSSGQ